MEKIALLILYNHRYDKNIPKIEELYRNKFSHLFHLIPFYDGDKENVIPVYESSHQYQSYISQAYQRIKHLGFTHYFVVADDMILNPAITEYNLFDFTGIPQDSCYITNMREICNSPTSYWRYMYEAYDYNPHRRGVEITNVLPPIQEAEERLRARGFSPQDLSLKNSIKAFLYFLRNKHKRMLPKALHHILKSRKLNYPLIAGWCDILILTEDVMPQFCTFCGAFAATELFVEIAVATALALCDKPICVGKDLTLNYIRLLSQLPKKEKNKFYSEYNWSLDKLLSEYPKDTFFIHPIKLSKWK